MNMSDCVKELRERIHSTSEADVRLLDFHRQDEPHLRDQPEVCE